MSGGFNLRIINVKGDGSCLYRCIWRIARSDSDVARTLLIDDVQDEDKGTEQVRYYVALSLKHEKSVQRMLADLINIYEVSPFVIENYPILSLVDRDESFATNCESIANGIENTRIMASSFEVEVIRSCLSLDPGADVGLIVLVRETSLDLEDLVDKLLRELHAALNKCQNDRIAVIINEDNIHYKYTKILGEIVNSRSKLVTWTRDLISEEEDSA